MYSTSKHNQRHVFCTQPNICKSRVLNNYRPDRKTVRHEIVFPIKYEASSLKITVINMVSGYIGQLCKL